MQTRTKNALVLGSLGLALGGGLYALARSRAEGAGAGALPPTTSTPVLRSVPADALVVAVLDLASLRASAVGPALLGSAREVPGLGSVKAVCGSDPIDTLESLAFAIPKGGEGGDFGVVGLGGPVDGDALASCAAKIIARRGGKPLVSRVGSFVSVRDESSASGGELAARTGGPILLGSGSYLRAMMATTEGRSPSVVGVEPHRGLFEGIEQRTVRLSFTVTDEQKRSLAEEAGTLGSDAGPLFATLEGGSLGVDVGASLTAHGMLACGTPEAAARVAEGLRQARDARRDSLELRVVGVASLLSKLDINPVGAKVHAHFVAPTADLVALLERVTGVPGPGASGPPSPSAPAPEVTASAAAPLPSASGSASGAPSATGAPSAKKPPRAPKP